MSSSNPAEPGPSRLLRVRRQSIRLRGAAGSFSSPLPGQLSAIAPLSFAAVGTRVQIGETVATRVTTSPFRYTSRPNMSDVVDATYVLEGTVTATCTRGARHVSSGFLVLSRPSRGDVLESSTESALLRVIAPAAVFAPEVLVAEHLPLLLPHPRFVHALTQTVKGVLEDDALATGFGAGAAREALHALMQLTVASALQDAADAPPATLRDLAIAHIDARFPDPGVTAATIALDLAVSLRTLQAAFTPDGPGVAHRLRSRRLEAAAERLRSDRTQKYSDLARDTGFSGADHLSRAFSNEFGCSLSEYKARFRDGERDPSTAPSLAAAAHAR